MMSEILFQDVSKSYGKEAALRDVTVAFVGGVTTAIVGPSGSGKSTLLQLINGLVRPTSGTVHIYGKPIDYDRLPELRRQIGYAVQGTGLFPHLTVERNITLLARLVGWEHELIRTRAEELMEQVGLPWTFATLRLSFCAARICLREKGSQLRAAMANAAKQRIRTVIRRNSFRRITHRI